MTATAGGRHFRGKQLAETTSLVGRRSELNEIKHALSTSRLVSLTGVGGVGKTRLALRAGWQLRRSFPHGVWMAELAGLSDGNLLAQSVVTALEIYDPSTQWSPETLAQRLADHETLIILDNCEHLLDSCATLVNTLLAECPKVRVLITSRQPLGIAGESVVPVPPLPYPPPETSPNAQHLRKFEAVRLFEERAAAATHAFTLGDRNGHAVAQVCQRLDGIPLAIELVAATLRVLSPEQLLQRLDQRLSLPLLGNRTLPARHQTLTAMLDWSFDLCTEQERTLWARCSVFAESFDLNAAENVCSDSGLPRVDVLDATSGLLDKSILVRDDREDQVRYRLPETIRQYGYDKLRRSGDERHVRMRHRDWYLEFAERMHRAWFGPDQDATASRMRIEHANVRAALEYCLTTPGQTSAGMRLADACYDYWRVSGLASEARWWLRRLLEQEGSMNVTRLRILTAGQQLALLQHDLPSADQIGTEIEDLAPQLGTENSWRFHQVPAAMTALIREDFARAVELCEEVVSRQRGNGELRWFSTALLVAGLACSACEKTESAVDYWRELLTLCEEHGETWRRAYALWGLGFEAWSRGDLRKAEALERKSLALQQRFHDQYCAGLCLETLGWIAYSHGRTEDAVLLCGAAQRMRNEFEGPLFPLFVEHHDQCIDQARRSLGEAAYTRLFKQGSGLALEQIATNVLGHRPVAPHRQQSGEESAAKLTRREQQVVSLVTQGLSDKQIAKALVISQRTAEAHVEHILVKLGFTSRTQIAAWSTQHRDADSPPSIQEHDDSHREIADQ